MISTFVFLILNHCSVCVAGTPDSYGIIVDAGSSGSRVRMFQWEASDPAGTLQPVTPSDEDEDDFEVEPGLSSYADTPSDAGLSLKGPVQAAKKYIPEDKQGSTPFFVKATAGMRLLEAAKATAVFDSVSSALSCGGAANSTFKFVSANIISGEAEGVFGYISANKILNTLGTNTVVGALDLGGASTQVTFSPATQNIREAEMSFYVNGNRKSVYSKSYMRFGQSQAIMRIMESLVKAAPNAAVITYPCWNVGLSSMESIAGSAHSQVNFTGSGDAAACSALAQQLMHSDYECTMPNCAIAGTHMTAISGHFRAFSAFFYTANGVGLLGWSEEKALSRKEIKDATAVFCGKPWAEVQSKYAEVYCFAGHYVSHILEAYGFAETDNTTVTYSRKINGTSLDWTLGAALFQTQLMPMSMEEVNVCTDASAVATSACEDETNVDDKGADSVVSIARPHTSISVLGKLSFFSLMLWLCCDVF